MNRLLFGFAKRARTISRPRNKHLSIFTSKYTQLAALTQVNKHYAGVIDIINNSNQNNHNNNHSNTNSNHKHHRQYKNKPFNLIDYGLLSLMGLSASMMFNNKYKQWKSNVSACGIMGVVGEDNACVDQLLDGLLILQNRGYDSAGVCTITDEKELEVTKYASKGSTSDSLDLLKQQAPKRHAGDTIGLAHTRWATHGAKTDENAHPHLDWKNRLAIVHNGTIENSQPIKDELIKLGIPFKSQTDTEVIVNLVSYYLDQINSKTGELYSIEDALSLALSQMEGSWGIAMLSRDRPGEIFAARNGSPLMIGLDPSQKRNYIASEHTAFARYTNQFISLEDGEIAIISKDRVSLDDSRVEHVDSGDDNNNNKLSIGGSEQTGIFSAPFSPAPYDHWTLKEMMEQPAAISRALAYGSRLSFDNLVKLGGLEKDTDMLLDVKHLVMTGCGTSYHAGLYAQKIMQHLNSFETVTTVDSAEVTVDTFPAKNSGMLAISQSGETKDVINALNVAEMMSVPRFSVVNAVGSMIARMTGCGVYAYAGREHAVASTKAFLSQTTVLSLIACWFSQQKLANQKKESSNLANVNQNDPNSSLPMHDPNRFRIQQRKNTPSRIGSSVDEQKRVAVVSAIHKLPTYCGLTLDHTRDACQKIAKELYESNAQHMFILGKGYAEPIAYEGALKVKEITYVHCEGYSGGALKHGPFALIENGTPIVMIILDDQHAKTMLTNAHEITSRGGKCIFITDNIELIQTSGLDTSRVIKIPRNGVLTALLAVIPLQYIAYELAVLKGHDPDKPKNLAKAVTVD